MKTHFEDCNIDTESIANFSVPEIPPWLFEQPKIIFDLDKQKKSTTIQFYFMNNLMIFWKSTVTTHHIIQMVQKMAIEYQRLLFLLLNVFQNVYRIGRLSFPQKQGQFSWPLSPFKNLNLLKLSYILVLIRAYKL